jgi:hypothetical protein
LARIKDDLENYCTTHGLDLVVHVMEEGIICDPDNTYLHLLLQSIEQTQGIAPILGKKLPGTSARFAPAGQGIVWGQTGIGPHSAIEKHYIPSILPYYQSLVAFGVTLSEPRSPEIKGTRQKR